MSQERDAGDTAGSSGRHAAGITRNRSARALLKGINLRDVGLLSPLLKKGKLYRSSQVVSAADMEAAGIRTIIDLRQRHSSCGRAELEFIKQIQQQATKVKAVPGHLVPEFVKPEYLRTQPVVCAACSADSEHAYGVDVTIFHVDLVNRNVQWAIFYAMPRFVKYKVLQAVFTCTPPDQIMAPAVANDAHFGYLKLYQTLLDSAKSEWARALRVLTHDSSLPLMVHCIHGKDRTGLFVMLVALLCGLEEEVVIEDYVLSERMLKEGRDDGTLSLPDHLSGDEVISAKRGVMQETIEYLKQNYTSAEGYARNIGLTPREIAKIRLAMLEEPSVEVLDTACALPGALRRSSGLLRSITLDPRRLFASVAADHAGEDKREPLATVASSEPLVMEDFAPSRKKLA